MYYKKSPLSHQQHLAHLAAKGLAIPDATRALRWLKRVSYYRLSAYTIPFKQPDGRFAPGTSFDQIADLYTFDRELRLLLLDVIERIEVALRACLTYELAHGLGPFGYTDANNFIPRFAHQDFMDHLTEETLSSKETFVKHYKSKYTSEQHLPIWMASELLSFGRLSRLYEACRPSLRKQFASMLYIVDRHAVSWCHSLNYVRNVCAHQSRLWNRQLAIRPSIPTRSPAWLYDVPKTDRLYCVLVIAQHSIKRLCANSRWKERLFAVFDKHPAVPLDQMQIPADWRTLPPWN